MKKIDNKEEIKKLNEELNKKRKEEKRKYIKENKSDCGCKKVW